jgi:hypothetical protein
VVSRFIPHFASLVLFTSIVACGSSSNGTNATSTVSEKTIDGVCKKLNSLSCAQPNCTETLSLAQQRCTNPLDDFQGLLDCMSIATFQCGGSPNIPRTSQCEADIQRVNVCSGQSTPYPSHPGQANGSWDASVPDVGDPFSGQSCSSGSDCTTWPCPCADGTVVDLASCTNNKCEDGLTLCGSTNAQHVDACKSHGGV